MSIQGDLGRKVNTVGGDIISNCKKKKLHKNMCFILNGYRDTVV